MILRSVGQLLIFLGLYAKIEAIGLESPEWNMAGMLLFLSGVVVFLGAILAELWRKRED